MPIPASGPSLGQPSFVAMHHSIQRHRNVVLTFSTDQPTREFMEAWASAVEESVRSFGDVAGLHVISAAAGRPSDEAKRLINAVLARHKHVISGQAYVVEGRGFRAAAVRAGLSFVALTGRHPFPKETFVTVADAARWVSRMLANSNTPPISPVGLERIVHGLRQQVECRSEVG